MLLQLDTQPKNGFKIWLFPNQEASKCKNNLYVECEQKKAPFSLQISNLPSKYQHFQARSFQDFPLFTHQGCEKEMSENRVWDNPFIKQTQKNSILSNIKIPLTEMKRATNFRTSIVECITMYSLKFTRNYSSPVGHEIYTFEMNHVFLKQSQYYINFTFDKSCWINQII